MRCDYCFVARKRAGTRMGWDTARAAVDFLLAASADLPSVGIHFLGGEPLLEFGLVRRVVSYANARASDLGKSVGFALTTNGLLLSADTIRFCQDRGFNCLLSMDGDQEAHDRHRLDRRGQGTWRYLVSRTLPLLKRYQGWVGVRMTVCPDTVGHLSRGIRQLHSHGVNQFLIGPEFDAEWSTEQLAMLRREIIEVARYYTASKDLGEPIRILEFEESIEERQRRLGPIWGCEAGLRRVAVGTDGGLYPCARFVRPFPSIPDMRMGDVHKGLDESSRWFRHRALGELVRHRCRHCANASVCAGGCPATNLHRTGSTGSPPPASCVYAASIRSALSLFLAPSPTDRPAGTPHVAKSCADTFQR